MGFIIYYLVLIVNPMGRILVRWQCFRNSSTLQNTAAHCNPSDADSFYHSRHVPHELQQTATDCNRLQHTKWPIPADSDSEGARVQTASLGSWISLLHFYIAPLTFSANSKRDCNRLQQTATDCNRLQNTATHCKTLQQTNPPATD